MADAQQLLEPAASEDQRIDEDRRGEMHLQLLQDLWDDSELNDAYKKIGKGEVAQGLTELINSLHDRRECSSDLEWDEYKVLCRNHPVCRMLHEDPFTKRAFDKPRGYAGDAVLLDYIYGQDDGKPLPENTTDLGREIFKYTTVAPAPLAVLARRDGVSGMLDRLVDDVPKPHVLSIAAGHMREAELARCIKRRKVGRLVALDSDADSLFEVEKCYGQFGVEVVPASIRRLLTGKLDLGKFDFVYSTGLFDYLKVPVGQRLVRQMFAMLKPGGRLMVANFLPNIRDVGYMEVFMAWDLIYRNRTEVMELTMEIPQEEIRDVRVFSEDNTNILFLEVTRHI